MFENRIKHERIQSRTTSVSLIERELTFEVQSKLVEIHVIYYSTGQILQWKRGTLGKFCSRISLELKFDRQFLAVIGMFLAELLQIISAENMHKERKKRSRHSVATVETLFILWHRISHISTVLIIVYSIVHPCKTMYYASIDPHL